MVRPTLPNTARLKRGHLTEQQWRPEWKRVSYPMAEKEKSGVRGMTVEQARSFLIFLRHLNKLEDSSGGLHDHGAGGGKSKDFPGSVVDSEKTQEKCQEEMRVISDHTDSMTEEPVPITCVWPRRSLEAVLADLRGDGSTEFRPQHQVSPSVGFDSEEIPRNNVDEDFVYITALSLDERDSLSEAGEESSEEDDDSRDGDYIPSWDGFKDHSIAQIEPAAARRSSRKKMTKEVSPGLLMDSSKKARPNMLVLRRSKVFGGEKLSAVSIDDEQSAALIPVSVSEGSHSLIGRKLDNSAELASKTNIPRQVVNLNQNDGVGLKEDRKPRNSGEWALNLQKRCHGAKKSLLGYKRKNRGSPNSTYNLRRRSEKGHNFGTIETPSACLAQLEIKSAVPKGGSKPRKFYTKRPNK